MSAFRRPMAISDCRYYGPANVKAIRLAQEPRDKRLTGPYHLVLTVNHSMQSNTRPGAWRKLRTMQLLVYINQGLSDNQTPVNRNGLGK